ncbi:hypothetical protein VMCG_03186 [Cytospora schulzeri]|uniref:Cytochrome P450 n=1 Tax=Cytospora schulzeri TaxID=448051 RepID=A0A423WY96_9PEZI|nr:hypothetical protein VMCG_03186 [Valsa malicola]
MAVRLGTIFSHISGAITTKFTEIFDAALRTDGNWTCLPSLTTASKVVSAACMVVFFGPDLSADQEFCQAALAYPEELFHTAMFLLPLPSLLWPITSRWFVRNHRASDTMVACLTSAVAKRQKRLNSQMPQGRDYLQFIIDSNSQTDRLTTEDIVSIILRTWIIAVHETAVTSVNALESLCRHPEYIEPLRHETSAFGSLGELDILTGGNGAKVSELDEAPLLDSFLRESSRLNPPNSITMRRKAQTVVKFRDGTRILKGDMACASSQSIMRSNENYEEASNFSAWRFIEDCGHEASPRFRNTTRFTGTELTYPLWGLGKHACPGRFYASAVLKLFIVHVLREYDIKLPSSPVPRTHHFASFIIPDKSSILYLRKRQEGLD